MNHVLAIALGLTILPLTVGTICGAMEYRITSFRHGFLAAFAMAWIFEGVLALAGGLAALAVWIW